MAASEPAHDALLRVVWAALPRLRVVHDVLGWLLAGTATLAGPAREVGAVSETPSVDRPWSREDLLTVPELARRLEMGEEEVRKWATRLNLVRELPGLGGHGRGRVRWGDVIDLHGGIRPAAPKRRGNVGYLDPDS